MSNICQYTPDPNILTQAKVNREFTLIHKHLCYLESAVGGGTVSSANDGLSVSGSVAKLGQTIGQSGSPASLTESREIPLNGSSLQVSGSSTTSFNDFSDDFIHTTTSTDSFARLRLDNSSTGTSAGIGVLFLNDLNHLGFAYMSSSTNSFINDGFNIVCTGAGGMCFTADAGDIKFGGSQSQPLTLSEYARFTNAGKFGLGIQAPSAIFHVKAGTATAGTAPIKLTSGPVLTTVENGAFEYDGTHFYGSIAGVRWQLDNQFTKGTATFTANGVITTVTIPHGLGSTPSIFLLNNLDPLTQNLLNRTITLNATNAVITYGVAPLNGENAIYHWVAYK